MPTASTGDRGRAQLNTTKGTPSRTRSARATGPSTSDRGASTASAATQVATAANTSMAFGFTVPARKKQPGVSATSSPAPTAAGPLQRRAAATATAPSAAHPSTVRNRMATTPR